MTEILIFISALAIFMGLLVWMRNTTQLINQFFLGLTLSIALWVMTNAVFFGLEGEAKYIDALISYGAAGMTATFLFVFARGMVAVTAHYKLIIFTGIVCSILSAYPGFLATGVVGNSIKTTFWIALYGAWVGALLVGSIIILLAKRKNVSPRRSQQISILLRGLMFSAVGGLLCNLILPMTGNYTLVAFGPACALIFIMVFAYSIIRQHLFDIRSSIVRIMAYAVSVILLGGILGYGGYYVTNNFSNESIDAFVFIAMGVLIATAFPTVKRLLDYSTRKIFFRNEYDTQTALDQMSDLISMTTSLKHLESLTTKHLQDILGSQAISIKYDKLPLIQKQSLLTKNTVVSRDTMDENQNRELFELFEGKHVAVYALLNIKHKIIGYIEIADKANGTSYSQKDINFIGIIADELAIAIQNAQRLEEISHFNDQLKSRITDATLELRESNKKLRQLDASKDEFISMASHQLRTPLTSIKGYISMLLDEDLGEIKPEQRKALEEAFDSSQRMVYLIGDFLNLSRIQTGKFELERASVSLPTLLGQEIEQLRQSAKARHVTLLYDEPANFPPLNIDETKIRQVMMNFIDNAIYYAKPSGGEILIVLETKRDEILFRVRDNGIGVPLQSRKKLFSKFFRADNAKKARPDGTGIGLYMAKRVVVAHGGEIIFESKEDEGSEFGFRLPT